MNRMSKLFACVIVLGTVGLALAQDDVPPGVRGDRNRAQRPPATMTVRGEAQLEKPADQMQISLSVVNDGKEASDVLEENSKMTQNAIDAMLKAGLEKKEYQTGGLNVSPIYSQRPRNADETWRPEIIGYRASHRLNIKTTKLDLIGKVIDAASDAGVNGIDSISFGLADTRKHRQESIEAATQNAIADARTLAAASHVRLVRIISINLDQAHAEPFQPQMGRLMAMDAGSGPPINAGDVNVSASVTIVYEIDQE